MNINFQPFFDQFKNVDQVRQETRLVTKREHTYVYLPSPIASSRNTQRWAVVVDEDTDQAWDIDDLRILDMVLSKEGRYLEPTPLSVLKELFRRAVLVTTSSDIHPPQYLYL